MKLNLVLLSNTFVSPGNLVLFMKYKKNKGLVFKKFLNSKSLNFI